MSSSVRDVCSVIASSSSAPVGADARREAPEEGTHLELHHTPRIAQQVRNAHQLLHVGVHLLAQPNRASPRRLGLSIVVLLPNVRAEVEEDANADARPGGNGQGPPMSPRSGSHPRMSTSSSSSSSSSTSSSPASPSSSPPCARFFRSGESPSPSPPDVDAASVSLGNNPAGNVRASLRRNSAYVVQKRARCAHSSLSSRLSPPPPPFSFSFPPLPAPLPLAAPNDDARKPPTHPQFASTHLLATRSAGSVRLNSALMPSASSGLDVGAPTPALIPPAPALPLPKVAGALGGGTSPPRRPCLRPFPFVFAFPPCTPPPPTPTPAPLVAAVAEKVATIVYTSTSPSSLMPTPTDAVCRARACARCAASVRVLPLAASGAGAGWGARAMGVVGGGVGGATPVARAILIPIPPPTAPLLLLRALLSTLLVPQTLCKHRERRRGEGGDVFGGGDAVNTRADGGRGAGGGDEPASQPESEAVSAFPAGADEAALLALRLRPQRRRRLAQPLSRA
ncbi:hypothetical protein DFH09DRAFT_1361684 [Mycena vulgaris]|nr:hypothetical protein DFH09DRAFT_1361684 [Mycena vulgaris]